MAVWVITGGLGAGKSLIACSRIREFLQKGLPVATNMDIYIEHLVGGRRGEYDLRRLPDYPALEDFQALGYASKKKFDEKTFGLIVLDEAAVFLNSREWNRDPNDDGPKEGEQKRAIQKRMALLKWLRHCRKYCWHLIIITQGVTSLDSQVRNDLIEHEVRCRRMDRLSVPVLSWLTKILGFGAVRMPQVHVGVVYYMELGKPTKVDTWYVPDAKALYKAYNTQQVLSGECLGASMLDRNRAPYLWEPEGWYERLWAFLLWRWVPPSPARRRRDDHLLHQRGLYRYKPSVPTFAEWSQARPAHAGALGGEAGEAPEVASLHADQLLEAAE